MPELDFLKSFHTAAQLLPERLWRSAYLLDELQRQNCEEFRVRLGRPFAATVSGQTVLLGDGSVLPTKEEMDELLARATECSVHSYLDQLWRGFLTTRHGHRLGICGQAIEGEHRLLRGLSSINLRIARQVNGLGKGILLEDEQGFRNTLILSPPGMGKTTLLRELCHSLSFHYRVAIADERFEIAACADGTPRFRIGNCDVLSGGNKRETVPMLLRAMAPQIIAVDEITDSRDSQWIAECTGCGCGLLATAHGQGLGDLKKRSAYRTLLEQEIFQQVIVIQRTVSGRVYQLEKLSCGGSAH